MLEFLKKVMQKKAAATESAKETYRRLAIKAATDGDLKDADAAKFAEVAGELGISLDGASAHVEALRELEQVKPIAAKLEAAGETYQKARQAVYAYDAETEQKLDKLRAEREQGRKAVIAAQSKAIDEESAAKRAEERRKQLEEAAWFCLGGTDPAITKAQEEEEKKRVYIVHGMEGTPSRDGVYFVEVFGLRGQQLFQELHESGKSIVKAPWQEGYEFSRLMEIAQGLARGSSRYLMRDGVDYKKLALAGTKGLLAKFDDLLTINPPINPDMPLGKFYQYPESDRADFEKMMQALRERFVEHRRNTPIANGNAPRAGVHPDTQYH